MANLQTKEELTTKEITSNERISIIIVTYKKFIYIEDVLSSIFIQDYPDIEIIISDDGSPNWEEVEPQINSYIKANRTRNIKSVIINHNEYNQGTVRNANAGLKYASGNYIKFIAQDDYFAAPDVISNIIKLFCDTRAMAVSSKMVYIEGETKNYISTIPDGNSSQLNTLTVKELHRLLLAGKIYNMAPGMFFKKDVFDLYGDFDTEYKYVEDFPFWDKLLSNGMNIHFSNIVSVYYRNDGMSNNNSKSLEFFLDTMKVYNNIIFAKSRYYGLLQPIYNYLRKRLLYYRFYESNFNQYSKEERIKRKIQYFDMCIIAKLLKCYRGTRRKNNAH